MISAAPLLFKSDVQQNKTLSLAWADSFALAQRQRRRSEGQDEGRRCPGED
jgi:hypothetical protein